MRVEKKKNLSKRRHWRVRSKVTGTAARPRMSVKFTGKNIHVQFIDDDLGVTIAQASTLNKAIEDRKALAANVKSAERIGTLAAEAAKTCGITTVVFDRGGAKYHGKVKALADAARQVGLVF